MTSDKTIPPGGEGEIKVTFNPKGHPGVAHKTITVTTNDPEHPRIPIKLHVNVVGAMSADPPNVSFGSVDFGAGASAQFAVALRADIKGKIKEARTGSRYVSIERLPEPDDKGRTLFRVALDKSAPIGRIRDVITVTSDAEKASPLRVVVSGNVVGDVDYRPSSLSISRPKGTVMFTRRPGKRPLEILSVESSTPDAKLELKQVEPGEKYQLDVTITDDKKRVRGKITAKVDNPRQPEIVIPLSYVTPARPVHKGGKSPIRRNIGTVRGKSGPGPGPGAAPRVE